MDHNKKWYLLLALVRALSKYFESVTGPELMPGKVMLIQVFECRVV
jgi:hypothetical protein